MIYALLVAAPLVAQADGTYTRVEAQAIVFGNDALELRFDPATGELRQMLYGPQRLVVLDNAHGLAGCDLNLDGKWVGLGQASAWRYGNHEVETLTDGAALHVTSTLNGWRLRATYRLRKGSATLQRSAVFTPPEGAKGHVNGVRLILPGLKLRSPADTTYTHLSNYPPTHVRFSDLTPGRVVDEQNSSVSGHFVLLSDPKAGLWLPITYYSDQEYAHAMVIEGEGSITVIDQQNAIAEVATGKPIAFGSQLAKLGTGPNFPQTSRGKLGPVPNFALEAGQALFDLVGLVPPEHTRELAAKTVMYSAHPGGTIDSGFRDVGGYNEFAKRLPYYADLGVNTLWLLPIWHGYVYAPDDYYSLDPRLGSEAELKALVDQAHGLGIRVLGDLIPHGPLDTSKLHEQHPDWICKNEDGSFQYWWGCLYCDYAHPGWQGFMADHATDWIKRVGLDGYRVDCAGGGPPNWRPYGDNRPSMSGLAGGLGVLTAARQEMETQKPEVFLLAEAGGPPFSRAANFTYNWAFLFSVAPALVDEGAATWVPRVSEWLEQQRYSFPRGSRQIMCLENHDTVRALLKFGVGTQKALLALAAFSDATPFLYHDQEIGYGPYLKRLYAVRREHDELTLGDASYTAIPASDASVLTILRTYEGRTALVAINFSGQPATCTVDLSGCPGLDPKQRFSLWDAFGERPVAGDLKPKLDLLPYSPAVILIRPAGEAPPAPPTRAGGQASLPARYPEVTRDGDRVTVSNGVYEMRIGPETGGLIESFTVNGQTLLGPMRFGTAGRRLWLGGDLVLGPDTFRSVGIKSGGEGAEVIVRGVVNRTLGGQTEPALDYQLTYYCFATPSISCRLTLTPRVNIEGVLGSLATTLAFPGATRWSANTFEGLLYDDLIPRRLDDQPYHSMYVRPHSDRLFSSESLPLDPQHGFIGAEWPDGTTLRVAARGWATGVPNAVLLKERLGDATGLHALLSWADGTKPLTLVKGQTYEVSYGLTVSAASPMQETAPRAEPHVPQLTAEGSRYIVETPTLRAAIARSKGGSLEELSLRGGGGTVAGTNVYSDYGIYGDWTDPSGVKHRTTALSRLDVECEPTIEWLPDPLRLTFEGVFRDANWSGRPIPEPRTQYRVSYEFTDEPFVSVECSARPQVTKAQVKAFLAQTLSLTGAGPWAVVAGETPRLLASGKPPGPGDRVWQSIADPLTDADLPRLFVETPGPTCVEFSDFAGLQDVQNLFYLQGRADSVLFIAFLDGQPEDLVPRWFTVRYRITPHRGALGEVLRTLGLPEPQEGTR